MISWHEEFGKLVSIISLPSEKRKRQRKLCVLATTEKWIPHCCWFKPYGCYLNMACHKSSIYHSVYSPSHFICECVQSIAVVQTEMCHCSQNQVSTKICKGRSLVHPDPFGHLFLGTLCQISYSKALASQTHQESKDWEKKQRCRWEAG